MIKKIQGLTKIFLKDYYQNLNIINKNNKLNKKSIFTWLIFVLIFTLSYLSLHAIEFLQKTGKTVLFLKIYFPIIAIIMIIQLIAIVCRIFYYSRDLEYIMPLPIKTEEILISKLNTVIIIMYFLEILYLLVPLLMYGILEVKSIIFFISIIIVILFFPILFTTIISIIMLFIMKLSKLIKNQDLFQLIVVSIMTSIIMFTAITFVENVIFEPSTENLERIQIIEMKTNKINKSFLVINPLIKILENNNFLDKINNLIKIIIINFIAIIIFILCGKKL
ncbi:MAG: hypothetical protein IJE59_05090, partial [Clostridia bacterium]|nr:hypothetical protein [Clostridia bacterium]